MAGIDDALFIKTKPIHNIMITIIKENEIYTTHFTCYNVSWLAWGGHTHKQTDRQTHILQTKAM